MRLGLLFGVEAFLFLIVTINFRACAKGWILLTVLSDILIAALGFSMVKWIMEAQSLEEQLAYTAGAALGSILGMLLTKHWKDA